jgi:hypothetical protein
MANLPAVWQPAIPEVGQRPFAAHGAQRLLPALTTEHDTLHTARSATIMEPTGRSALTRSTISSAAVALAAIGQLADGGQPFFLVAPALLFLGSLTDLRPVQRVIADQLYARASNRIRWCTPLPSRWRCR